MENKVLSEELIEETIWLLVGGTPAAAFLGSLRNGQAAEEFRGIAISPRRNLRGRSTNNAYIVMPHDLRVECAANGL